MKLKDYLSENKISVNECAKKLGACIASVYQYCNGIRPRKKMLRKILDFTNNLVTPADLGYEIDYTTKNKSHKIDDSRRKKNSESDGSGD